MAIHDGLGLCSPCYQRDPARVATWTEGALTRLGDNAPHWFVALAQDLRERCTAPKATFHLRRVEQLLAANISEPAALIDALATPGRSPGATTRLLDEFFVRVGIGGHLDETNRLAAGRRMRRLSRVPEVLRPAVEAFAQHLLDSRSRAVLLGHYGLADVTIEARIADLARLAQQLNRRQITDWASVGAAEVEAFITTNTGQRLATCRGFFAFARRHKIILINPVRTIVRKKARGFSGRVLTLAHQRQLVTRWTDNDTDSAERVVGLLSLLHGASCAELRRICLSNIDLEAATIEFTTRPHRVPLDPLTATALADFLVARSIFMTSNPHLVTTVFTRGHAGPASSSFMSHILDDAGVTPKVLRQTRLADLAHRLDPRLVSAAFGMTEGGALHYVLGAVDNEEDVFNPHL